LRFHPARCMQLLLPLHHQNPTTNSGSCIALDGDGEAVWCVDALDGDGGINRLGIGDNK
ncbi:hypothetical protein K469DRAFT_714332, partial [Zopfia rhizophila CBS 207.26]